MMACYWFLILSACSNTSTAFEIPNLSRFFKPPSPSVGVFQPMSVFPVKQKKAQLLDAISGTANGKTASPEIQEQVLALVAELEQNCPVSDTLLSNPSETLALDGTWFLQYTSPSVIGDDNDNFPVRTRKRSNETIRVCFCCPVNLFPPTNLLNLILHT